MSNTQSFGKDDYEIVSRDVVYEGIFRLARYHVRHRLFKGGFSDVFLRELMERYSAAAVLPYDPKTDRVILIEQFRMGGMANPNGPWLLEIPAGVLVGNVTPEETAFNEAQEEAGCEVTELLPICEYFVSPGGQNEYINVYCGKIDASNVKGVHGLEHEHEDILVHNLTFDQALAKLQAGEIKTSPAIIGLLWLQINREMLREKWK